MKIEMSEQAAWAVTVVVAGTIAIVATVTFYHAEAQRVMHQDAIAQRIEAISNSHVTSEGEKTLIGLVLSIASNQPPVLEEPRE